MRSHPTSSRAMRLAPGPARQACEGAPRFVEEGLSCRSQLKIGMAGSGTLRSSAARFSPALVGRRTKVCPHSKSVRCSQSDRRRRESGGGETTNFVLSAPRVSSQPSKRRSPRMLGLPSDDSTRTLRPWTAHYHQADTEPMGSTRTRVRPRLPGGERSWTGVRRRRRWRRPWGGREQGPPRDERVPGIEARALLAAHIVMSLPLMRRYEDARQRHAPNRHMAHRVLDG